MAYNPTPAINAGDLGTSAWAQIVKGNFDSSALAVVQLKGDLAVATGVTSLARLPVGADGTTLIPDSTGAGGATGMRYQMQPAVSVYSNANFDCGAGVWTSIIFTGERWDSDGMWAIGTPHQLIVPVGGAGLYHIGGNVEFDSGGGAGEETMGIYIWLNGATIIAQSYAQDDDDGPPTTYHVSRDYRLQDNDTLELRARNNNGDDVLSTAQYSPEFWATWIRTYPP